ncbi:MAG: SGNH/GDSL hydrolase family protein [Verrucomicrobiales bacterium]|nr:SGNH/GDSL hydrolase family protein [Verrucomicrobiales bacterium]
MRGGSPRSGLPCLLLMVAGWGMLPVEAEETSASGVKEKTADVTAVEPEGEADKEEQGIRFERKLDFSLTPEQAASFEKWLPRSYRKLVERKPFHMVAIGDSIVDMYGYDEDAGNWLKGYPGQFAAALSRQFFYTGGVRLIRPEKGTAAKERDHMGPEITLRNLGRGGRLSLHAIQALGTYGLENQPDLVLISFGINDSTFGLDAGLYARAIQEAVDAARSAGSEVLLLGPTAIVSDPPEQSLAATRLYTDTLRDVAAEGGIPFVDLGDLAQWIKVDADLTEPEDVFRQAVARYRHYFDHEKVSDFVHPRAELYAKIGRRIYDWLIGDPGVVPPWKVEQGTARVLSGDKMEVTWEVENLTEEPLQLMVLPLVVPSWKPLEAAPVVNLDAKAKTTVRVTYGLQKGAKTNPMPSHEPMMRLPVFMRAGEVVRVEDVRASLEPLALLWKVETQFNVEKEFVPANLLVNTSEKTIKAQWEASWMGQTGKGEVELEPGTRLELPIRFDLPDPKGQPFRQTSALKVVVKAGEDSWPFEREVVLTRNFGLKDSVPLSLSGAENSPPLPELGSRDRSVTLRADADNDWLFLVLEIRGIDLADDPTGYAYAVELNLDARSYGKRLMQGVTDAIRIQGKAADGAAEVRPIPPWAFGTGYAASFEESEIRATLASGAEGARRLTLTLPRSYLYMHEWAMGNGNSELGVNLTFNYWVPGEKEGEGTYGPDSLFALTRHRHRDDAEGLAVLELQSPPTPRWSITIN